MSNMTVEELKEQLTLLPDQFRQALVRETEARFKADRLEASVEKLREKLKHQDEDDNNEPEDEGSEDDDTELIKLESAHDRLKVKLQSAEDKAEIAFRRENPKATNEHVKAAVGNNSEVERLRLELIDAKEECKIKKITLQRARREAMNARLEARRESWRRGRGKPEPESEELDRLEEEHAEALREVMETEDDVEVLRAKLDTFKLLIQLENIG
jgi:hypothetical protein